MCYKLKIKRIFNLKVKKYELQAKKFTSISHRSTQFLVKCILDHLLTAEGFKRLFFMCHQSNITASFITLLTNICTIGLVFFWLQLNGTVELFKQPHWKMQMSILVVVFLWSQGCRVDASRADGQAVCGYQQHIEGRGKYLPDSFLKQTENQMSRSKAQWSTLRE